MPDDTPPRDAVKLLNDFLEKEGIVLAALPQFLPRDDATFSVVVRISADFRKV